VGQCEREGVGEREGKGEGGGRGGADRII